MTKFTILFGGEEVPVTLIDGTKGRVFVRRLPWQHLARVIEFAEHGHKLIGLTAYFRAKPIKGKDDPRDAKVRMLGTAAFPEVDVPTGYQAVPAGWESNLDHSSFAQVNEAAQRLNWDAAIKWANQQIATKKLVAPLHKAVMEQMIPIVESVVGPLQQRLAGLSRPAPGAPE